MISLAYLPGSKNYSFFYFTQHVYTLAATARSYLAPFLLQQLFSVVPTVYRQNELQKPKKKKKLFFFFKSSLGSMEASDHFLITQYYLFAAEPFAFR